CRGKCRKRGSAYHLDTPCLLDSLPACGSEPRVWHIVCIEPSSMRKLFGLGSHDAQRESSRSAPLLCLGAFAFSVLGCAAAAMPAEALPAVKVAAVLSQPAAWPPADP